MWNSSIEKIGAVQCNLFRRKALLKHKASQKDTHSYSSTRNLNAILKAVTPNPLIWSLWGKQKKDKVIVKKVTYSLCLLWPLVCSEESNPNWHFHLYSHLICYHLQKGRSSFSMFKDSSSYNDSLLTSIMEQKDNFVQDKEEITSCLLLTLNSKGKISFRLCV